uniref:RING-type domain-containing protein n=1 Tax=Neobodo designis TaxID=312471 RepID=A0A7S1QUU4_NEODS|mmetsp:Transcript_52767/g.162434  ORF Transcript_52767/g.162434 Transcript_52767/m.162434 type:complete len:289 (+) Transcript_52767:51-917(+)
MRRRSAPVRTHPAVLSGFSISAPEHSEGTSFCIICALPAVPHVVLHCGHSLCDHCSRRVETCPTCRARIQTRAHYHARTEEIVSSLRYTCDACDFVGTVVEAKRHKCPEASEQRVAEPQPVCSIPQSKRARTSNGNAPPDDSTAARACDRLFRDAASRIQARTVARIRREVAMESSEPTALTRYADPADIGAAVDRLHNDVYRTKKAKAAATRRVARAQAEEMLQAELGSNPKLASNVDAAAYKRRLRAYTNSIVKQKKATNQADGCSPFPVEYNGLISSVGRRQAFR